MLDRLSLGLVSLPESTYDVVLILTDANGTRAESQNLLGRRMLATIVKALKPNGKLRSQDGTFASVDGAERTEAILAGLLIQGNGEAVKPDYSTSESVPLRLGKTKRDGGAAATTSVNGTGAVPQLQNGKRKSDTIEPPKPADVGFVDFSDDFDEPVDDDDEELAYPPKVQAVKMIDFAHARWTPGEGRDENVLHGIGSVISILEALLAS